MTRKNFMFLSFVVAMAILLAIPAFGKPNLNKKTVTIKVGQFEKLKVKGTKQKVKWSSSNKKVAIVSWNGNVFGNNVGTAIIKAKVGKKVLKCKITVIEAGIAPITPTAAPVILFPTFPQLVKDDMEHENIVENVEVSFDFLENFAAVGEEKYRATFTVTATRTRELEIFAGLPSSINYELYDSNNVRIDIGGFASKRAVVGEKFTASDELVAILDGGATYRFEFLSHDYTNY